MATKKANGEGSITEILRNGKKLYKGTITIGFDENGKQRRKTFTRDKKKDVINAIAEYRTKMNAGTLPNDDKLTFEQWFYTWLFEIRKHDLKPSTFERYEGIYRNYVKGSSLGKKKLTSIRTLDLQSYFNALLESKMAPSSVTTVKRYISTSLNEAVKQEYLNKNYCSNVKLPKAEKKDKITVLSAQEQKLFIESIHKHKLKALFYMALGTGLRQGELLALKWDDIDMKNKTVTVNKSIKKVTLIDKDLNRKGKVIEQTPKTETSQRIVPLPDNVILALLDHKEKQDILKEQHEDLYSNFDYVFSNDFGMPMDSKLSTRNLQRILKSLKIDIIPFHALRHTYATRLFEANVPVKTVQALLGHKDIHTTMNIYTHVMPEEKQKSVDKINDLFSF